MTRPFEPAQPRAAYVVQIVSSAGRQSIAAPTALQRLLRAEELLAASKNVQIFGVGRGLLSIQDLQQMVQQDGDTQDRT